jgi:alpha-D-ribose 1-methylphosphonate 5-triphosphate synthase subunit PhnG
MRRVSNQSSDAAQHAAAMLQTGDGAHEHAERAAWMQLLACAPLEMLESWSAARPLPRFSWLRRPETGLVMVRGRVGGDGERFNLGEMTVTRCALRLASGVGGVAYVRGRSARHAELAALADALLQVPGAREPVERELLAALRARRANDAASARRKAQATRVDFFTLARAEA